MLEPGWSQVNAAVRALHDHGLALVQAWAQATIYYPPASPLICLSFSHLNPHPPQHPEAMPSQEPVFQYPPPMPSFLSGHGTSLGELDLCLITWNIADLQTDSPIFLDSSDDEDHDASDEKDSESSDDEDSESSDDEDTSEWMAWNTDLVDHVEDEALNNPVNALADREWFLDPRLQYFRARDRQSALEPSPLRPDFSRFSRDDRLTLLDVSWQLAHSQRRRARNLQKKLDDNHKELERHQKKSAYCVKLVTSSVHKRAARNSAHQRRQRKQSPRINCPICQSTEINVVTGCGHVFCKECINHWKVFGKTCPTCRKPLEGPYPLHI